MEERTYKVLGGTGALNITFGVISIVVGLTARGKDADKFWFSLFHELAHITLGHVGRPNGTSEEDEKVADQWADDAITLAGAT